MADAHQASLTSKEVRDELKRFAEDIDSRIRLDLRDELRKALKEILEVDRQITPAQNGGADKWETMSVTSGTNHKCHHDFSMRAWRGNTVMREIRENRNDPRNGLDVVQEDESTPSQDTGAQEKGQDQNLKNMIPSPPAEATLQVLPTSPALQPEIFNGANPEDPDACVIAKSSLTGKLKWENPKHRGSFGIVRLSQRIIFSTWFDYVVGVFILLNAAAIGVHTDYLAQHRNEKHPKGQRFTEVVFCVVFTTELFLRIVACNRRFLCMSGWHWNLFDSFIVFFQLLEEGISIYAKHISDAGSEEQLPNLSFMRVLRVLRLIRIIRLVRILRLIGELRTLVSSIACSLKSLAWTVVLLFLIIYAMSVYFTQVVRDNEEDEFLDPLFGSLGSSMVCLFQSVTGGIDWRDVSRPLSESISPLLSGLFCMYIAFTILAVMNVVTGVFVESALISAKNDQEVFLVNSMREFFMEAKGSEVGELSWDDFNRCLDTEQMKHFFKVIDVDTSEAHGIFRLLDLDKSGGVELEEFVSGCHRLRGNAKALDLAVLIYEIRRMADTLQTHIARFEDFRMMAEMHRLSSALGDSEQDQKADPEEHPCDAVSGPPSFALAGPLPKLKTAKSMDSSGSRNGMAAPDGANARSFSHEEHDDRETFGSGSSLVPSAGNSRNHASAHPVDNTSSQRSDKKQKTQGASKRNSMMTAVSVINDDEGNQPEIMDVNGREISALNSRRPIQTRANTMHNMASRSAQRNSTSHGTRCSAVGSLTDLDAPRSRQVPMPGQVHAEHESSSISEENGHSWQ